MSEGAFVILKYCFGGITLGTLVKWLHSRDNRLESRIQTLESERKELPSKKETRQLIEDLNAPLEKDIEYIKEQTLQTNKKLDILLENTLNK